MPRITLPRDPLDRIRVVGEAIFGSRGWKENIPKEIGYSRVSLHRWTRGVPVPPDVDLLLAEALARAIAEKKADLDRALATYDAMASLAAEKMRPKK